MCEWTRSTKDEANRWIILSVCPERGLTGPLSGHAQVEIIVFRPNSGEEGPDDTLFIRKSVQKDQ